MAASHSFASVPPSDGTGTLLDNIPARKADRGEQQIEHVDQNNRAEPEDSHVDVLAHVSATNQHVSPEANVDGGDDPWQRAQALMEADEVIETVVTGHNKGGLLVHWHSLQGFVPASQLTDVSSLHVEEERMAQLEARRGELLQLKIIEVQPETNRLIFSERATEVTASAREDLLAALAPGQVRNGVVTNLADFGAFVDLGGVEGLIHISELSWRRLTHPGDVVRPGQKLKILVMSVNAKRGRVALSRKKLREDPWLGVEERYRPGQRVSGEVSSVADFGVFVLLEEGLEGLLHISEMDGASGEMQTPVIRKGASIKAQVIYVSERKRRLALTLCDDDIA